jgi:hypothetical protein
MASIYHSARLDVPPGVAWDFLDRYTRSEVHVFSACVGERREGDSRVVTLADGTEVYERNVTVDPDRMRAVYTVPGLSGSEHHQAEMRVIEDADGGATLIWITDLLPDSLVHLMRDTYQVLFSELVGAVNGHEVPDH